MNQDILLRNNTGSKSKTDLIDSFVVRTIQFEKLKKNLVINKKNSAPKNTIIIGQRGAGKTTLIHRLNYEILDNDNLSKKYLPILFSEEQYNLSDLTNLWENIAVSIDDTFYEENLSEKINYIIETERNFEQKSCELLQNFLLDKNKTAILFIENINFFLKKLSKDEKSRLFQILDSHLNFKLIGTSTTYNDGSIDFTDPSYEFFDVVQLDSLDKEECEKLLIKISQQYDEEEQIKTIIENHPGRIEALRRLTGGVPRTISYLFQIFMDNENGKAIKDLYLLIDTLTLLYKSELDQLSTQQQKVVDAIAIKWDAISVKEIAKKTRLESKNISSILAYLEKNQMIEKITTDTKNNLYRIKERFMNIWYLMRFGRKNEKDNVIWLVRFFDAWCDESELTNRVQKHINNLKGGNYDLTAAIDMGNTFLSCENIPESLKEELIKTTNSILPNRLLKNSKNSENDSLNKIKSLIKENKFEEAQEILENTKTKNLDYYTIATSVYLMMELREKALEAAKTAWQMDDKNSFIALSLGALYDFYFDNAEKAVEFYQKSLDLQQPHPYAAHRIGEIILKRDRNYEEAIKYQQYALSKNIKLSLISLGNIYFEQNKYDEAEKFYREALNSNIGNANTKLAKVYTKLGKKRETELALKHAIDANEDNCYINLGRFYLRRKKPNFEKAEIQFIKGIDDGDSDGYTELAKVYLKKNELQKAIDIFEKGIANGNAESAHQLGHLFLSKKNYSDSDKMFKKAIDMGDLNTIGCWVGSFYDEARTDKKAFALKLLEENREQNKSSTIRFNLLYGKILLWNEKISDSLNTVKQFLYDFVEEDTEDSKTFSNKIFSDIVDYFLLLIAKKQIKIVLELFIELPTLKKVLKPIYYLLMEELKEEFPNEYLKAGRELIETIKELKYEIDRLQKNVV